MSELAPSLTGSVVIAFDCDEPVPVARFWQRLLGGELEVDSEGDVTLHSAGGMSIDFARVPEPKSGKNRLHLDLGSRDFDSAVSEVLALGATRADDVYDGGNWQVLRDPEGNEFCILKPRRQ